MTAFAIAGGLSWQHPQDFSPRLTSAHAMIADRWCRKGQRTPVVDRDFDDTLREAMLKLTSPFATDLKDLDQVLAGVTAAAVELVPGADYADVMLVDAGQLRSVSPTAALVADLDAVQLRLGEGPCLVAAVADAVIRCPDLKDEPRWPRFAAVAVEAGVHSMLSFQLFTHHHGAGALNLLGRHAGPLTPEAEAVAAMLAAHAATALMAADKQTQFQSALASRDLIGQAKGILMERFSIDAVHAFGLLRQLSQDTNTPLKVLAQRTVDTLSSP